MPFNQAPINYAAQYGQAVAAAYPFKSYYPEAWGQGEGARWRPLNGKTVYIPAMTTSGAVAANRDSIDGSFARNFNVDWQACTAQMDREWSTLIDPVDAVETNQVATIANVTRLFNEQKKIPEQDAYMSMKLAAFAGAHGGVSTTGIDASSVLGQWDLAIEYMTNQRVPIENIRAKVTPTAYKHLKEASGVTRFVDVAGNGNVNRNVHMLDGVEIMVVPADMMKTAYTFTEGWAIDAGTAAQINMLLYDVNAIAAPVIYDTAMVSAGSAATKGKDIYYERYYYDVFPIAERQAGIWVNLGSAPTLGTLTVTSVAGTENDGDTVITVTGNGIYGTGACAEGLKLVKTINDAAVTVTYNAVPDASKTWTDLTNGGVIASQTAGKYITVALVNKQTGYCVSGGNTTLVVKA